MKQFGKIKGELKLYQKKTFGNHNILEIRLWEVEQTAKYPDGIKYSLIFINPKKKTKVLMDNHAPKGHHYHLNDEEYLYDYTDISELIENFKHLVEVHMGVSL